MLPRIAVGIDLEGNVPEREPAYPRSCPTQLKAAILGNAGRIAVVAASVSSKKPLSARR
jgi:hypothetical protein